jgi:hypothetical protein
MEINLVPVVAGVYVNDTPPVEPDGIVTVFGVNVPPLPPSDGVIMTDEEAKPFGLTVKLLDATPTFPVVGPVKVIVDAATFPLPPLLLLTTFRVIGVPLFVRPSLFVIEMNTVPVIIGVYTKVTGVEEPAVILIEVGENVPPFPLSEGTIVVVLATVPLGVTVKFAEGFPITSLAGPDNVIVVALVPPLLATTVTITVEVENPPLLDTVIDFVPILLGV